MLRLVCAITLGAFLGFPAAADVSIKRLFDREQKSLNAIPQVRLATLLERSNEAKASYGGVNYTRRGGKKWLSERAR